MRSLSLLTSLMLILILIFRSHRTSSLCPPTSHVRSAPAGFQLFSHRKPIPAAYRHVCGPDAVGNLPHDTQSLEQRGRWPQAVVTLGECPLSSLF
ncbi:hypothetical protein B0H10DRAFT_2133342 [Mycena sp. CBHHK59/15]|nr:hypothetical protein B0H10DRAFT_2133342 [Mycena sp. CBHHK59/15]